MHYKGPLNRCIATAAMTLDVKLSLCSAQQSWGSCREGELLQRCTEAGLSGLSRNHCALLLLQGLLFPLLAVHSNTADIWVMCQIMMGAGVLL